jgi:hypothetical protein
MTTIEDVEASLNNLQRVVEVACRERDALRMALEESVRLQSHYAGLLNAYDGGHRIEFADAADWLRRLAMTREERSADAARRAGVDSHLPDEPTP